MLRRLVQRRTRCESDRGHRKSRSDITWHYAALRSHLPNDRRTDYSHRVLCLLHVAAQPLLWKVNSATYVGINGALAFRSVTLISEDVLEFEDPTRRQLTYKARVHTRYVVCLLPAVARQRALHVHKLVSIQLPTTCTWVQCVSRR